MYQSFPSALDLKIEPKPQATPEVLTSEKAANDYDVALEAWGQRGWDAVGRVCQWSKSLGMSDAPC